MNKEVFFIPVFHFVATEHNGLGRRISQQRIKTDLSPEHTPSHRSTASCREQQLMGIITAIRHYFYPKLTARGVKLVQEFALVAAVF